MYIYRWLAGWSCVCQSLKILKTMSEKKNQEGIVWNVAKNAIGAKLGQQGILKSLLSETIQHLGKNPFQGIQNQKQKFWCQLWSLFSCVKSMKTSILCCEHQPDFENAISDVLCYWWVLFVCLFSSTCFNLGQILAKAFFQEPALSLVSSDFLFLFILPHVFQFSEKQGDPVARVVNQWKT